MAKLAIYSPNLEIVTETFIRKHIKDLAPNETVIITGSGTSQNISSWVMNCPTYILSDKYSFHFNWRTKIWLMILHTLRLKSKNNLYYHKGLAEFLIQNDVKIILCEYLDYSTVFIDLAKKLNIKLYAHGHGYDVSKRLKQRFWKREYLRLNKIAGIITVSDYSKKKLIDIGLNKELIHVIPCGINLPPSFTKVNTSEHIKCIAVGRMISKKAPLLLLESFRLALDSNDLLVLDFIGSGALFNDALEYVKKYKLKDKVKLRGSLPNEVVKNMMRDADIFLQHSITNPVTSDQEGLPVAILEAMSHYLPVISTFHAGIPEAVINNETGLLVNEADTKAMAKAILKLAENKSLRTSMGIVGREIIEKKFTWEIERRSLLNLIGKANLIAQ